jgi:AAA15 family ATPase/GTPase
MIKEIEITNFYSFKHETIKLNAETNILVGINGSGKSNFLKVLQLLKESIAGVGLEVHLMSNLGGFDNCYFKGGDNSNNHPSMTIQFTFDGHKMSQRGYGFRFTDDIIYTITIVKSSSLLNFYLKERIYLS